jgi:hypothetical protein
MKLGKREARRLAMELVYLHIRSFDFDQFWSSSAPGEAYMNGNASEELADTLDEARRYAEKRLRSLLDPETAARV